MSLPLHRYCGGILFVSTLNFFFSLFKTMSLQAHLFLITLNITFTLIKEMMRNENSIHPH